MRKVKVLTDSTADLNEALIAKYGISTMALAVNLGEQTYRDGVDVTPEMVFKYAEETKQLPKTAAPSVYDFEEYFRSHLDDDTDIVYMGIGSKLSASMMSAKLAAESVSAERIHIVDSMNLSTGIGLLVCKAGDMMLQGCSADEIVKEIEATAPKVRAGFVVDTVEYLYMGGRCSSLANMAAGILKLRPRLVVKGGIINSDKKYRGTFERCLSDYTADCISLMTNIDDARVFVTNAVTPGSDLAKNDAAFVGEKLKEAGINNIEYTNAGCVISSHCGPRTLGILYIDK